jgi:hypothetical protein
MIIISEPATLALLEDSEAMMPSGMPVPNFSGRRENF